MNKSNTRVEEIELEEGKGYVVYFKDGESYWLGFSNLGKSLETAIKAMRRWIDEVR